MKRFNVTGNCVPNENYMVDISDKITKIRKLVDEGSYFTINKARQYGKTTTLATLEKAIENEYIVASISFQGLGDNNFASDENFCATFMEKIQWALQFTNAEEEYVDKWVNNSITDFVLLDRHIAKMCKNRKMVLMIDEVDQASNNRVFLNFLGMLREKYIARRNGKDYTFHSVILAGVYDVKTMKLKMMSEGKHTPSATEDTLYNSPWNIAADFEVDMSFSPAEIVTMLNEYECDYNTGMDIPSISEEIYKYTSGYPFLVSRICQRIDEKLDKDWTADGIQKAVKMITLEKNTLFEDLTKNLENNNDLYKFIYDILINGWQKTFSATNPLIDWANMFGIIKYDGEKIQISNKIFEIVICDYFISKDENREDSANTAGILKHDVVRNGKFDMELCLRKFAEHYEETYTDITKFLENDGKFLFITYLRPLINGDGFYHFESQLTDNRRLDVVVDYNRQQFILEMKIWRGEAYENDAFRQLADYLTSKNATTGYLLTFDFRGGKSKKPKAEWVKYEDKQIFDVIV